MVWRAVLALIACMAVFYAVSSHWERGLTEGPGQGVPEQAPPGPPPAEGSRLTFTPPPTEPWPLYQPAALYPEAGGSQWGAGPPAYPLPEHDLLTAYVLDPGFTLPMPAPPPEPLVSAALSEAQIDDVLDSAGWPEHLWDEARAIIHCESRYRPDAVGDGGNSLGMFQLWFGWFSKAGYSSADYADPVVNASVARYVYEVRGNRWGGGGGWSCADKLGIP